MNEIDRARECARLMYAADTASRELGIEIEIPAAGKAIARMTVTARMLNGHRICHGGYVFTLADSAFAFACNAYGEVTVAAGAAIDFLRPAREGDLLVATATERQRGGRAGVYDVEVQNQDGRRVALFRGRSFAAGAPPKVDHSDT